MMTGMLYVQPTGKWHVFNLEGSAIVVYQDVIPTESPELQCIDYDDYLLVPGRAFGESHASLLLIVQKDEYLSLTKQPPHHFSLSPTGVVWSFALGCYGVIRTDTPMSPSARIDALEFEFDALNYLYPPITLADSCTEGVAGISASSPTQFDFAVDDRHIQAELSCSLAWRLTDPAQPCVGSTKLVLSFDPQPVPFAIRVFTVIRQFMQCACFCKEVGPYGMRLHVLEADNNAHHEMAVFSTGLGLSADARKDLRVPSSIPRFSLWEHRIGTLLSKLSDESWFTVDPTPDTVHDRDYLTYFRVLASCTALVETAKPVYEADIRGQKNKLSRESCGRHKSSSISLSDILHEAFHRFWTALEPARRQVAFSIGMKNFGKLAQFHEDGGEQLDSENAKIDYWCKIIVDMRNRRAHQPFSDSYSLEQILAARFVDMLWYAVTLKRCGYTMKEIGDLICVIFGAGYPPSAADEELKGDDC